MLGEVASGTFALGASGSGAAGSFPAGCCGPRLGSGVALWGVEVCCEFDWACISSGPPQRANDIVPIINRVSHCDLLFIGHSIEICLRLGYFGSDIAFRVATVFGA